MSRIVLSTSSSGLDNFDIPNKIELIRLRIFVNNVEFTDGWNISNERLRYLMTQMSHSPVRTAPAPASEVRDLFTNLKNRGYNEIFITVLSSGMSQSYNIIQQVADEFKDSLNIYVYDCKELNVCEGLFALEAERMMNQGVSMPKIASHLDELRRHHRMLYAVDNLSYLIKNKKISATAGLVANILNLKPVITVTDEGVNVPYKKIRSFDKALDFVIDELAPAMQHNDSFAYLLSAGRPEIDQIAIEQIKKKTALTDITVLPVSAISLANHGPVGFGLCVFDGVKPYATRHLEYTLKHGK